MDFRQFSYFVFGTLFGGVVAALTAIVVTVSFNRSVLDDDELVVGVVSLPASRIDKESYETDLKNFLVEKLGSKVDVEIDLYEILPQTSFNEIQDNIYEPIQDKDWDIAFALTPLSSLKAYQSDYKFLARMFWQAPNEPQPPGIFFVRSDSPITDFEDITINGRLSSYNAVSFGGRANDFIQKITTNTEPQYSNCRGISTPESEGSIEKFPNEPKIALGSPSSQESLFTFYIPLYHLYGSSFFADTDNTQCEILVKVLSGETDVGVGIPPIPVIKEALDEKLIREVPTVNQDKILPYSGVFLSPDLSKRDQARLSNIFLSAPEEMMQELHYVDNQQTAPNYDELANVNARVEEIITCLNWQNETQDELVSVIDKRDCTSQ